MLSEAGRKQRARIAAFAMHAGHDVLEVSAAGRLAAFKHFEQLVDPEGVLSPEERQRRAVLKQREHMARIAFKSAKTRARKKRAASLPQPAAPSAPDGVTSTAARLPNRTNSNDRSATSG